MKVIEEINRRPYIKKISFVAHSVGGLVARYAIGRLYKPPKRTSENTLQTLDDNNRGTIHGLEAVNFITVASPHLGSRGNKQVPSNFKFRVSSSHSEMKNNLSSLHGNKQSEIPRLFQNRSESNSNDSKHFFFKMM